MGRGVLPDRDVRVDLGIKGLLSRLTGLTVMREMVEDKGVRVEDIEIEGG